MIKRDEYSCRRYCRFLDVVLWPGGARQFKPSCVEPTRCSGLWDGLVDTGTKAAADWNVTG